MKTIPIECNIFIFESSSGGVRNNGGIRVTTYCTSSTTALQVWSMTHFVFYFTICVILREHLPRWSQKDYIKLDIDHTLLPHQQTPSRRNNMGGGGLESALELGTASATTATAAAEVETLTTAYATSAAAAEAPLVTKTSTPSQVRSN